MRGFAGHTMTLPSGVALACDCTHRRSISARAVATLGLIALVTTACAGGGDTRKAEIVRQALPSICNDSDSLIFSDVQISPEDEDLSGLEIVLHRRDSVGTASSREATGEFEAFVPLTDIKGDSVPGSISFSLPDERDTAVFRGRIYYDSLVGELRHDRTKQFQQVAYARIRDWTFNDARYRTITAGPGEGGERPAVLNGLRVFNTSKYLGGAAIDITMPSAPWRVRLSGNWVGGYSPFRSARSGAGRLRARTPGPVVDAPRIRCKSGSAKSPRSSVSGSGRGGCRVSGPAANSFLVVAGAQINAGNEKSRRRPKRDEPGRAACHIDERVNHHRRD